MTNAERYFHSPSEGWFQRKESNGMTFPLDPRSSSPLSCVLDKQRRKAATDLMNNILVEKHSLLVDDGCNGLLQLNRLINLVKYIQNGLDQIVVYSRFLARHGGSQVLQDLVDANTDGILTHKTNLSERADSLTAHLPVSQHGSLLQTDDDRLVELNAVNRRANCGEDINAISQEPVSDRLEVGDMLVRLFAGRNIIQQTEDKLEYE